MSRYQSAPEGKDPALWDIAQKRASFKRHALTYIVINVFLWVLWYFTGQHKDNLDINEWGWGHFPWPLWTTIGWGIGLAFHFAGAYIYPNSNSVEREYEKLKNKK